MIPEIQYGNREGQYFSENKFDFLRELLQQVHQGPNPPHSEVVEVEDVKIWYDQREDFHRLSFNARGHFIETQFYKVYSVYIDGKEHWVGCLYSNMWELANSVRKELGVTPKAYT